jgi:protein phosphatase 1G
MEDSEITLPELSGSWAGSGLFAVFDGHGGREVAGFCRKHVPNVIQQFDPKDPKEALKQTFHKIDDYLREPQYLEELATHKKVGETGEPEGKRASTTKFIQNSIRNDLVEARSKGSLTKEETQQVMMKMLFLKRLEAQSSVDTTVAANHVGCTANACIVRNDKIYCANAGDSRTILCRSGKVVPLSFDHKPNHVTERTRIENAGGHIEVNTAGARTHYRVNGNLNLSRAIGDLEYKQRKDLPPEQQIICSTPDIKEVDVGPNDEFLVLACDGIWDVMSNEQVCAFVKARIQQCMKLTDIAEELLDRCLSQDPKETQGLGCDNMTAVIVDLQPAQRDRNRLPHGHRAPKSEPLKEPQGDAAHEQADPPHPRADAREQVGRNAGGRFAAPDKPKGLFPAGGFFRRGAGTT